MVLGSVGFIFSKDIIEIFFIPFNLMTMASLSNHHHHHHHPACSALQHLVAMISLLAGSLVQPTHSHSFDIVWNSPWPAACTHAPPVAPDAITKWGVRTNADNAFNGAVVSTLYNHPGALVIGDW